jgi:hypothetical protein
MKRDTSGNYEVRRGRWHHPGHTVIEVVKGEMAANNMAERLMRERTAKEIEDGVHYGAYKTRAAVTKKKPKTGASTRRTVRR